jgi:CheY-like chemotaxis protein
VARVLELLKDALAREQFAQTVLSESHRDLEELMQRRTLELVDARDAAHAAMRAKTVFLANMSHELRTPLHAILGFSTLVRSGPGLSEDQRKDLDIVRRSGEQLLDLIDEVLDLSNSESGAVVRNADFAEGSETAGGVSADDEVTGLAPGQPECRILIVEEQRENSRLLERLLQNAGFRVNLAENGLEGIEACRIWHPHLVWMDLGLSGMSCVETARRMRLLEGGQQVKIVALTTSALGTGRDGMPASGLDDVVRKPCRRREIFDCMERMLGVTYNYGKRAPLAAAEMGAPLTPEALSALPEELCAELEDALISLDVDRVTSLTSRVAESYPRLGGIMTSLSNNLAYTTLLRAIAARKVDLVVDRP